MLVWVSSTGWDGGNHRYQNAKLGGQKEREESNRTSSIRPTRGVVLCV